MQLIRSMPYMKIFYGLINMLQSELLTFPKPQ